MLSAMLYTRLVFNPPLRSKFSMANLVTSGWWSTLYLSCLTSPRSKSYREGGRRKEGFATAVFKCTGSLLYCRWWTSEGRSTHKGSSLTGVRGTLHLPRLLKIADVGLTKLQNHFGGLKEGGQQTNH